VATIIGPWHCIENIFEHEGNVGHQIMCVADIELDERSIYDRDLIEYAEDDGTPCFARWFTPHRLPNGVELYPRGLLALIDDGLVGSVPRAQPCATLS
jgi:hypothetical protein